MEAILAALPAGIDPWTAGGLLAVSFLASLVTAAMGLGGGLLMLAVLAGALPPAALIPVHGVVQLGSNLGRTVLFRRSTRYGILLWFALGAAVGVSIGAGVAVNLPRPVLLVVVAVFILVSTWAPKLGSRPVPARGFLAVGAATAFISMFVGATGPFLAPFLSPERLGDRQATIGTMAACMSLKHGLKVAAFAATGFVFLPWLPFAAAMIATGFLGSLAGRAVVVRLPERWFRLVFRLLLSALALRILWQALAPS
ncbi:sulfite exporter TauE/SafE family protein [Thalassobaculum sp.]|uniref:sulfite exporter TauE/SafE family protein n=1 Tax=Thalassobaculum sp. TaxID=2022740 RepID=UPI0032ED8FED